MKLFLRKVKINSGGYAPAFNYRYFGINLGSGDVYHYGDAVNNDTEGDDCFLRAPTREYAKTVLRKKYGFTKVPVTFYR